MNSGLKKFFIRSVILFLLVSVPGYFLSVLYNRTMFDLRKEKAHWVLGQENGVYDFAFLGSSRVYNCLDTKIVDSIVGSRSLNLGVGGAAYPENYLLFYNFLKNKNKTKVLFVQIDVWGLIPGKQAYNHSFSEEKYLHLLGDPVIDSVYLHNTNQLKFFFRKYGLFFKYAEFNNVYPLDQMMGLKPGSTTSDINADGSKILDGIKNGQVFTDYDISDIRNIQFSRQSIISLKKIIELARKNDIRVVLFTSPSYSDYMKVVPLYNEGKDTISKLVREERLDYYTYETDSICRDSAFFRDFTHLNRRGANHFSKRFALEIKKYKYE